MTCSVSLNAVEQTKRHEKLNLLFHSNRLLAGHSRSPDCWGLHSALGYVTPADKMAGREPAIFAARDRQLEAARQQAPSQGPGRQGGIGSGGGKIILDRSDSA